MCKYHTSILVYKTLNNMAPSYMTDIISFSKNDHYSIRSVKHNDLVLTKKPKTQFFKDSFSYYSISIWNEIPCNIRISPSINSFQSLYRNYLFNNSKFFVLQLYMFPFLLDLWIYVSVCHLDIFILVYFISWLWFCLLIRTIWETDDSSMLTNNFIYIN